MIILRNLIIIILGAAIGYTFADIDLAPPLPVKHRSAWTHGPLIPIGIYLWAPGGLWDYFLFAFLLMFTVHLLQDSFPKKWAGGSLIKWYPIPKTFGPVLSFLWIQSGFWGAWVVIALRDWGL